MTSYGVASRIHHAHCPATSSRRVSKSRFPKQAALRSGEQVVHDPRAPNLITTDRWLQFEYPNFLIKHTPPVRPWKRDSTDYNPYALEMVPFSAVDPNDFYTMSVHGRGLHSYTFRLDVRTF